MTIRKDDMKPEVTSASTAPAKVYVRVDQLALKAAVASSKFSRPISERD